MKILILNGSPRAARSLSLGLSRDFTRALTDSRTARGEQEPQIEEVHLVQSSIEYCRGCFACWKNPEGRCVIRDDMDSLLPRYLGSDLIIWSMPLYHFGMPALLKNVIERTLPVVNGEIIADGNGGYTHPLREAEKSQGMPRNLVISTCGFPSLKNNYEALHAHCDALFGSGGWERIECAEGELLGQEAMRGHSEPWRDLVRQAAREWDAALARGKRWPGFSPQLRTALDSPMLEVSTFLKLANVSWGLPAGDSNQEETSSILQTAEIFLRQMAIMYDPAKAPPSQAVLEMHFTDLDKRWFLVMDNRECSVTDSLSEGTSDTIIHTTWDIWHRIGTGELDGSEAMMRGEYRVSGGTDIILRMADGLFSGGTAANRESNDEQEGSTADSGRPLPLFAGLAPWIAGWILLPLSHRVQPVWTLTGLVGLSAALLAYTSAKCRSTFYERANPLVFAVLGMLALAFPDIASAFGGPVLYASSALLWGVTVLGRPLTADYSAHDYPAAIRTHPIFVATNRIMTGFWACVYGLQAAIALILGATPLRPFSALILQALLIPAGIFTAWFPGWYSNRKMLGKPDSCD